jgi:hypothetical protein
MEKGRLSRDAGYPLLGLVNFERPVSHTRSFSTYLTFLFSFRCFGNRGNISGLGTTSELSS